MYNAVPATTPREPQCPHLEKRDDHYLIKRDKYKELMLDIKTITANKEKYQDHTLALLWPAWTALPRAKMYLS